jgi:hypothetical protein
MERSQQLSEELINHPVSLTPAQIYWREYYSRPEVKKRRRDYQKMYVTRPESKERAKAKRSTEEAKAKIREP